MLISFVSVVQLVFCVWLMGAPTWHAFAMVTLPWLLVYCSVPGLSWNAFVLDWTLRFLQWNQGLSAWDFLEKKNAYNSESLLMNNLYKCLFSTPARSISHGDTGIECWKERWRPGNMQGFGLWPKMAEECKRGNERMPKINLDYAGIVPRKWLAHLRGCFLLTLYAGRRWKLAALSLYLVMERECIPLSYTYAILLKWFKKCHFYTECS